MSGRDRALGSQEWPEEQGNIEPSAEHITGAFQDARQQGPLQRGPSQQASGQRVPAGPRAGALGTDGRNPGEHSGQPAKARKRQRWLARGPRSTGRPSAERPSAERPSAERPSAERPSAERPGAERPSAAQPTGQSVGEQNPGWAIVSYLVAGMAVYGAIGWLIGRWTGYAAMLFPVGLLCGLGLALTLIILRYGRS